MVADLECEVEEPLREIIGNELVNRIIDWSFEYAYQESRFWQLDKGRSEKDYYDYVGVLARMKRNTDLNNVYDLIIGMAGENYEQLVDLKKSGLLEGKFNEYMDKMVSFDRISVIVRKDYENLKRINSEERKESSV